jgi:Dolichyl-phosphate-mannose-protein mannosyltransferase
MHSDSGEAGIPVDRAVRSPKMSIGSIEAVIHSPSTRLLLSLALGLALVLRLVAILLAADLSPSAMIWEYGEQAACAFEHETDLCRTYSSGDGYFPSAYMPPLLSYVWLVLFELFGNGVIARAVWLAASLMAALGSVALTFYLCLKLVPLRSVAFIAACLVAGYPTFVFVSSTYHHTNWAILLLLAVVATAVKLSEGANPWRYGVIGGVLCGLAALNRSEMIAIAPLLIAIGALWPRNLARILKVGLSASVAMAILLAPWTIRNYELFGNVIPTAQSQGYNIWKGYNPYTIGSGNQVEERGSPGRAASERIEDPVPHGPNYEKRVQDAYMDAFKADVRDSSVSRLAKLALNKAAMLWLFDWTDQRVTGSAAYRLPWIATNLLAIIGLVVAWRNRRRIVPAPAGIYAAAVCLLTGAYVLTSVHARYRMHIEPFVFMMAALGAVGLWTRIRAGAWRLPED